MTNLAMLMSWNVAGFLFLLSKCSGVLAVFTRRPVVEKSINAEYIPERTTLVLSCVATSNTTILSYSWMKNRIELQNQRIQTYSFEVQRVEPDSFYSCVVTDSDEIDVSPPVTVRVSYMDHPIASFYETYDRILLNDTVVMNCAIGLTNVKGPANYSWSLNSVLIDGALSFSLRLSPVRVVDDGNYMCSVTLGGITKVSNKLAVSVLYPPVFIDFDVSDGRAAEGSRFAVTCSARDGKPALYNISWAKPVVSGAVLDKDKLIFNPVGRNDTGVYVCSAGNGIGNPITRQLFFAALGAPDPPIALRVKGRTDSSITLTWLAPEFVGHDNVTGYGVNWGPDRDVHPLPSAKDVIDTTASIEGLSPASSYYFRVRARNTYGFGGWSSLLGPEITAESPPSAPSIQSVRNYEVMEAVDIVALEITWLEPEHPNGFIARYILCYQKIKGDRGNDIVAAPTCNDSLSGSLRSYIIASDLDAYSTYRIDLRAMNSAGPGAANKTEALTRDGVPLKVPDFKGTSMATEENITLSWEPSPRLYGVLTGYTVQYSESGGGSATRTCIDQLERTCTINRLKVYTNYTFYVRVANRFGSAFSDAVTIATLAGKPPTPPPSSIRLPSPESDTSILYQLLEFPATNGPISFYQVVAVKLKSAEKPKDSTSELDEDEIKTTVQNDFLVPYVVANFSADQFGAFKKFVLGAGSKTSSTEQGRSRRSVGNLNPKLEPDTYYTVFQRGFVSSSKFSSTDWFPPVKTKASAIGPSSGLGGGAIAGIVIGALVGFLVAIAIVLVAFCKWKQRKNPLDQFEEVEIRIKRQQKSFRSITTPPIHDPRVPLSVDRFEDHVNQLKANSNYGFSQEYLMINRELDHPYEAARLPENNIKNRYHNVPAYDHSRFKLLEVDVDSENSSDYINANYIEGFYNKREYIATQGPLPETIVDFWKMVWESDTTTIVMLTRLEEKSRVKCAQYWPESGTLTVRDIIITTTEVHEFPDHVVRTLHVTKTGQAVEKLLKQFHFMAWPDFGVPDDPSSILAFMRKINKWRGVSLAPVVIHCSAGVGRTGTYITIDSQIHNIKKSKEINVYANVTLIREQRCLMVQTEDQYIFIHDALLDYLDSGDTEIEASELREYIKRQSQVDPRTGMTGLMDEFIRLAKSDKKDKYTEANKHVNEAKNRYKNVSPYDETRVKLSARPGVDGSDYINANFIDSYASKNNFIATQAPLETTLNDFWRMIWEHNCGTIVMLTKDMEAGQIKAFPYWPQKVPLKSGVYLLEAASVTTYGEYVVRELKLTNTEASASRVVKHFQFTGWPDQGSPESGFGIIDLIGQVLKWNASILNKIVTVHCSAGVGRTGVFIALTNLIERLKTEAVVDVYQAVKKMRQQRTAMVQTRDQYEFCYRALQEYLDSFDLYSNFN